MKIAIIGSREFSSYAYLEKTINIYFPKIDQIISGGARGADSLGRQFAVMNNLPYKEFIPDWD